MFVSILIIKVKQRNNVIRKPNSNWLRTCKVIHSIDEQKTFRHSVDTYQAWHKWRRWRRRSRRRCNRRFVAIARRAYCLGGTIARRAHREASTLRDAWTRVSVQARWATRARAGQHRLQVLKKKHTNTHI